MQLYDAVDTELCQARLKLLVIAHLLSGMALIAVLE